MACRRATIDPMQPSSFEESSRSTFELTGILWQCFLPLVAKLVALRANFVNLVGRVKLLRTFRAKHWLHRLSINCSKALRSFEFEIT